MVGRTHSTQALLLRSVDYADAHRILTLLTTAFGKIAVLARGARASRRRFAGVLEPFAVLDAEVSLGKGELGQLVQAQVSRPFSRILRDLSKMAQAGAALQLVRELAPVREPNPPLFALVTGFLQRLDEADGAELDSLGLRFRLKVMSLQGFAPQLWACGHCGKRPGARQASAFDARAGHIVCQQCGGAALELSAYERQHLLAMLEQPWPREEPRWDTARAQHAIDRFVEHRLERRLASTDLLRQLASAGRDGRTDESA